MICNVALLFNRFRAAVCFCAAGFRVYTLHALLATEKKKEEERTYGKDMLLSPTIPSDLSKPDYRSF